MEGGVPHLLAAALRPASTRLTSRSHPVSTRGGLPGAVGAGAHPGIPGSATRPDADSKPAPDPKPGISTTSNQTLEALND